MIMSAQQLIGPSSLNIGNSAKVIARDVHFHRFREHEGISPDSLRSRRGRAAEDCLDRRRINACLFGYSSESTSGHSALNIGGKPFRHACARIDAVNWMRSRRPAFCATVSLAEYFNKSPVAEVWDMDEFRLFETIAPHSHNAQGAYWRRPRVGDDLCVELYAQQLMDGWPNIVPGMENGILASDPNRRFL